MKLIDVTLLGEDPNNKLTEPAKGGLGQHAQAASSGEREMGRVLPFARRYTAFEPEMAATLGVAYDKAVGSIHDIAQPDLVRQIIAKRIVVRAAKGECDPDRLCDAGLAAIGLRR